MVFVVECIVLCILFNLMIMIPLAKNPDHVVSGKNQKKSGITATVSRHDSAYGAKTSDGQGDCCLRDRCLLCCHFLYFWSTYREECLSVYVWIVLCRKSL